MFLWFIGGAVAIVWYVMRDPRFDVRLLVAGALAPDLLDAPFGGPRVMHSLTASVGLMVAAVAVTSGRKPIRKRLIAFVFGTFLHLVLDGVVADTTAFWWPISGRFADARLPSFERSLGVNLLLEAGGALAIAWAWRTFGLRDPNRRRALLHTGELHPC